MSAAQAAPVFGDPGRYYACSQPEQGKLYNPSSYSLEKALTESLLRRYPDLKKTVERTFRRWNLLVRDTLRTETALRLSVGDNRQVVPVSILDGLPRAFGKILKQAPDFLLWDLALHQDLLTDTRSGLAYVSDYLLPISGLLDDRSILTLDLESVSNLIERLVFKARQVNLLHAILGIEEDVLGAYFFPSGTVGIYWVPIGIVASLLDVSVEALTVVVLAHELAHAYTHLGLDIDGRSWNIDDFAHCDLRIVEGLAQFYALEICKKISPEYPAALAAFEKLRQEQPSAYSAYENWIKGMQASGELVRYCLIRTRTQAIREYSRFEVEVDQGRNLLNLRETSSIIAADPHKNI